MVESKEDRFTVEVGFDPNENCSKMTVMVDGKVEDTYYDGSQPEDNTLTRDYNWVKGAIEKAYRIGFEHGNRDYRNRVKAQTPSPYDLSKRTGPNR